jgi:hypothetical protein
MTQTIETVCTVSSTAGFRAGDAISIEVPDENKWRRFLHFITFRPEPKKYVVYKLTQVGNSTFTIERPRP